MLTASALKKIMQETRVGLLSGSDTYVRGFLV